VVDLNLPPPVADHLRRGRSIIDQISRQVVERLVPGETIELPTNGLQNRYSMIDRGYVQGQ
jgi:hypothetical protein